MKFNNWMTTENFYKLMRRVDKTPKCWLWKGSAAPYGTFWAEGQTRSAHRTIYEIVRGAIPSGLHLDHLCRVPRCVNPWHLEAVTPKVNTLRGETPAAKNLAKSECPKGHPYSHVNSNGKRCCRVCLNESNLRYYHRAKELYSE